MVRRGAKEEKLRRQKRSTSEGEKRDGKSLLEQDAAGQWRVEQLSGGARARMVPTGMALIDSDESITSLSRYIVTGVSTIL